jgi:hypothetical protein
VRQRLAVPDFFSLLGDLALDEAALDGALGELRGWVGARVMPLLVSRDYVPYLEYATPTGNALRWARESNLKWIESLGRRRLPRLVNVPDEAALRRVQALAAHARGNCDRALRLLGDGRGPEDEAARRLREDCERRVRDTDF